ncbi:MAG: sigma-70 family RNA polymerase sigma factor [Pedobacter sp.]
MSEFSQTSVRSLIELCSSSVPLRYLLGPSSLALRLRAEQQPTKSRKGNNQRPYRGKALSVVNLKSGCVHYEEQVVEAIGSSSAIPCFVIPLRDVTFFKRSYLTRNQRILTVNMHDFEHIYKTYSPQIFRVCMGYVNDHDKAKDLVQETFIAVWKNLSGFRNESKLSTWIYRIATNHCLRALEKDKRVTKVEMPEHLAVTEDDSPEEKLAFLYTAIAGLPEIERIIISLELEGLPQAQIAEITGMGAVNIRVRIHRIKEKLANKFKEHGRFE